MNQILSGFVRRLAMSLAIGTALIAVFLVHLGEIRLIGAVFAGYLAAGVCIWTLVYRTWRGAKQAKVNAAAAKGQMLWGFVLRLFVCFATLAAAGMLGRTIFAATAVGLLFFYAAAMFQLVYANHRVLHGEPDKK